MGNMKFDGADVTFELDGYDALVERVRSKKVNCKINPSDLPRLYAVMDAELEGNEELAAAFAEAQEAAFGEAVLTVWAERIKSFKDSFIPVFGEACKDAACRFGFSKDGNNTFKSAVDAFAANICDLYGAAPQIVDGFCEFLVLASIYFSPFSPTHFRQSRQRGYAGFANADVPLSAPRRPPPSRPHRRWTRPSGGTTGPLS